MAEIHDLIAQIGDERLRGLLAAEWAGCTTERKFGLVFEEHLPDLLSHGDAAGWLRKLSHRPWPLEIAHESGAEQFVRLEIDRQATMHEPRLVDQASQFDAFFDGGHRCSARS